MSTTLAERLRIGREQAAYKRRVAAFGLPALLAPYRAIRLPRGGESGEPLTNVGR